jgi:Gpi18-like mannosyltransferase
MNTGLTKTRVELLILFVLYLFLLPRVYMEYDMGFWREWALYIHRHGLSSTYTKDSPINYFPVFAYGLYIFDLLQGTDTNIIHNINSIKILFVIFDFLPIVVFCAFRQRLLQFKIPYLFLLLNIAYVFNSMIWGQIDGIYTNLAFLAIVTAVIYPAIGMFLFMLALNTKQQAIVFLPVIIMVLAYSVRNFKSAYLTIGTAIVTQVWLLFPFRSNGGISILLQHGLNSVGLYHNLSISAFNFWYLVSKHEPYLINDTETFVVASYHVWGLALFAVSGLAVLAPLMKKLWQLRKVKLPFDEHAYRLLFLCTGMLCLCFFYFNTQMHERYAHPIIIFFFFYGVVSKNYWLFALASIPYLLSLDKAFSFPDGYLPIVHYKIIYASRIIALWYTAVILYGGCLLWRDARIKVISDN